MTAGAAAIEPALLEQLEEGGTLVAPVGGPNGQRLLRIPFTAAGAAWYTRRDRLGV